MAGVVRHAFVSADADGPDATQVQASKWNQDHTIDLSNEYTSSIVIDLRQTCLLDGTTNETTQFEAARATLAALGGGTIWINKNKVLYTDRWTHATAGVKITLDGGGEIKLRTASDSLIKCNNATATVHVKNLKLNGNGLALTNNSDAIVLADAGHLIVEGCEVYGAGTAASGTSGGIASNTGATLQARWNEVHDCRGMGIHSQGTGKCDISHNWVHDCGHNAIFVGPNSNGNNSNVLVPSDGFVVAFNQINNIVSDLGGTGQYGNAINVYTMQNGTVMGNQIDDVAWSFIRINHSENVSVIGNRGTGATETGAWAEGPSSGFPCKNITFTGNVFTDMGNHGLSVTNQGGDAIVVTGNTIKNFGIALVSSTYGGGIVMEYGVCTGNRIDGNNNASATYAIKIGSGAGTANDWQSQIEGNQTAGCKYDVGLATSATGGVQRMKISDNFNVRRDANFASPIGAVGGFDADSGDGHLIGSTQAVDIFWSNNLWGSPTVGVPTGEQPPTAEVGSRMRIGGVWQIADGVGWNPELTKCVATVTYGTAPAPVFRAMDQTNIITVTNATAFTIAAPTGTPVTGARVSFRIKATAAPNTNSTWNAAYHLAGGGTTVTNPANGFTRVITFEYDGTNWLELSRNASDVAN